MAVPACNWSQKKPSQRETALTEGDRNSPSFSGESLKGKTMIDRMDMRVKALLTENKILEPVQRFLVVLTDILDNETQWVTDRNYLRIAVMLYVLRLHTARVNGDMGKKGDEIFNHLTFIPSTAKLCKADFDAWYDFLERLHGYSVPKTLRGDVNIGCVSNAMFASLPDNQLPRVCSYLSMNIESIARNVF